MHPSASFIHRHGKVDTWDNTDFRAAVQATGKKQVVLAGITIDVSTVSHPRSQTLNEAIMQVCTAFLALSLRDAGYSVWANSDASGTFDKKTAQDANDHMRAAGVQVVSMFAVALELMRDWRSTPRTPEMMPFFDQ